MKWRNSKERELLASGGSREQTLPNKNNPNPDLSDARLDRPSSMSPPASPPSSVSSNPDVKMGSPQQQSTTQQQQQQPKSQTTASLINFKKAGDFKVEFDEMASTNRQFMTNFYDRAADRSDAMISSPGGAGGYNRSNSSSSENNMTMYYDEYDSNSDDSDEEINVT
jgi:hypothetical protein